MRQQVLAYCERKEVPRFSAMAQADRAVRLNELRAAMGLSGTSLTPMVAQKLPRLALPAAKSAVQLSAIEGELVRRAIAVVCVSGAERLFSGTCALAGGERALTLAGLQRALLDDALAMGKGASVGAGVSAQARDVLLAVAILFEHTDVVDAAEQLPSLAGALFGCPGDAATVDCAALRVASEVIARALRDDPALGLPEAYYAYVLEEVLSEELGDAATPELLAEARRRAPALVTALRAALRAELGGSARIEANAAALLAAMQVMPSTTVSRTAVAVGGALPILRAAFAGDLVTTFRALEAPLTQASAELGLPRSLPAQAVILAEVAAASTDKGLRSAAYRLLGVPVWADPWTADAHLSVPKLATNDVAVNGDLAIGYGTERYGVAARGSALTYQLTNLAYGTTQTQRYSGNGEGYLSLPVSASTRVELRVSGGGSSYNTTNITWVGGTDFGNQQSSLGYGNVLVGAKTAVTQRLAVALFAGGGVQYELYNALTLSSLAQSSPVSARAEARLYADFRVVPEVLSVRVRAEGSALQISRSDFAVTFDAGPGGVTTGTSQATQLELMARGYVVVDALRFLGFLPAAHVGFNFVGAKGSNGEGLSTWVPVVGIGVRRDAM